jgi:hypothetical protein
MRVSNLCLETRWGLGLQNVDDMPPENLYYFGLVRLLLSLRDHNSNLSQLAYSAAPLYVKSIPRFQQP